MDPFKEALAMEEKDFPLVRDILLRTIEFSSCTIDSFTFFGAQGLRKTVEEWARMILRHSGNKNKKQTLDETICILYAFAQQNYNECYDKHLGIDMMVNLQRAIKKTVGDGYPIRRSIREFIQSKISRFKNFKYSTEHGCKSITFRPEDYHNSLAKYLFHAYENKNNDGFLVWILIDFPRFIKKVELCKIKIHQAMNNEDKKIFWWSRYQESIDEGVAIAFDTRIWGGKLYGMANDDELGCLETGIEIRSEKCPKRNGLIPVGKLLKNHSRGLLLNSISE